MNKFRFVLVFCLLICLVTCNVFAATYYVRCPNCGEYDCKKVVKDATCSSSATTTWNCPDCGYSFKRTDEPALGHDYVEYDRDEPTYTESGTIYEKCSRCNRLRERTLSKIPHDCVWVETARKDATIYEAGYVNYECSLCSVTKSETIPKVEHDHNWVQSSVIEPTPTESGVVTYTCFCGDSYTEDIPYVGSMYVDTYTLGAFVFKKIWGFFNIYVPGFSFTFGQMLIGIACCSLSLFVLKLFLGVGGRGVAYMSRHSRKPKISENRKGDQY